nr:transposase (putative), gypsy type [Tanacetum cinerariifolium]
MLHLAARLGLAKSFEVSGAAYQMQQELLWFKYNVSYAASATSEAQLLISSHGHGGHSVSLMAHNQSSFTAIRVVAEPYVQDAPTKHATTFKRNDEVLSLGRNNHGLILPVSYCRGVNTSLASHENGTSMSPLAPLSSLSLLLILTIDFGDHGHVNHLMLFCEKFHIPEEVHHVLPNRGDTIHERLADKIGLYNSKRSDNVPVYYTKPLCSLKNWNDYFFWVDSFACPALFSWHTAKKVTRDPAPVAADFNARDYATHMDLFAFIHTLDPTKVKIFEWERIKDEPLLLQNTVGRTVPLLPVALNGADSELETSIDRLFDEGGSGSQAGQGGSTGVREGTNIQPVTEATGIVTEDVAPLRPRRQRKRKIVVADAGGSLRPPRKLREDHGTLSEPSETGNSSALQRFVISSDSSHHSSANVVKAEVDSLVRSSVPMMTDVTITTSTADHAVVVKEKTVKPSLFVADSSLVGGVDPNVGVFLILLDVTFLAARQMSLSGEVRMRVKYNIKENMRLKFAVEEKDELVKARDKEIENLKAHMALKEAKAVEAIRLCAVASNFMTVEMSLRDEVNVVTEHNTILEKERDALVVKVADLEASTVIKEREITNLSAQFTSIKSHNDSLIDQ